MTNEHHPLEAQFEQLKSDEWQQSLADQAQAVIFADKNAAQKTAEIINAFIDDYLANGRQQPIEQWLLGRFSLYPEIWENEQEKQETARTLIEMIDSVIAHQVDINAQLAKGKTLANVLHKKLEKVAEESGIAVDLLQQGVDSALQQGNLAHTECYLGQPLDLSPQSEPQQGLDASRQIAKKLILNANLNLAWYGAKSIGTRLFNSLTGKENRSRSEELRHIIRSAVDSAENKGVQVAVSGGLVVSAKKGWVAGVFDTLDQIENTLERTHEKFSRLQDLALNVAGGWNDVRLLDQVERGALLAVDVAAEKAKFAAAQAISKVEKSAKTWLKAKGAAVGTKLGAAVGSIFGPAGTAIGGVVGGFLGEQVGDYVGEKIVTPIANVAKKVANVAVDTVKNTVSAAVSTITEGAKSFVSSVGSGIASVGRKIFSWF